MITKRRVFLSGLLLILIGSIGALVLGQFRIRRVVVISSSNDIKLTGLLTSHYIFQVDSKEIAQKILTDTKWRDASVAAVFPNTVEIRLVPKTPVAILKYHTIESSVSNDGTLLSATQVKSLPEIDISSLTDYRVGESDWRVTKVTEVISQLSEIGLSTSKVTIEQKNSRFIISLRNGTLVVVPQTYSPSELAASLQIIIARFRIEGKTVSKIDFQYDKPIIILSADGKS